jgi:hypothetical protein
MQEVCPYLRNILDKCLPLFLISCILSVCLSQIGHVTKTGDIAGPRLLEHIVDVVLYMEVGELLFQIVSHTKQILDSAWENSDF